MALELVAEKVQAGRSTQGIDTINPRNPFLTQAYVDSRIASGSVAWLLRLQRTETLEIEVACLAYLKKGAVRCGLEIPSLPDLNRESPFWDGLHDFCRRERVTDLGLNTFGSEAVSIPVIGTELGRRARAEYVIDLSAEPLLEDLAKNHRRNVRKAERAGLVVRVHSAPEAARQHAFLVGESADRRRDRGEDTAGSPMEDAFSQLLHSGVACIYQAVDGDEAVSSILLLMAAKGVYYHSAGTSPKGMEQGASPFLILNIARELHSKGFEIFNLGGADASQAGLVRFKSGFNARRVDLEAVTSSLQGKFRRKAIGVITALKDNLSSRLLRVFRKLEGIAVVETCTKSATR